MVPRVFATFPRALGNLHGTGSMFPAPSHLPHCLQVRTADGRARGVAGAHVKACCPLNNGMPAVRFPLVVVKGARTCGQIREHAHGVVAHVHPRNAQVKLCGVAGAWMRGGWRTTRRVDSLASSRYGFALRARCCPPARSQVLHAILAHCCMECLSPLQYPHLALSSSLLSPGAQWPGLPRQASVLLTFTCLVPFHARSLDV